MADEVHAGAAAFLQLLEDIGREGARPFDEIDGDVTDADGDLRDYSVMVAMVEASLRQNVVAAGTLRRQGYLRALAHMISLCSEGFGPGRDWDPLSATEAAFAAPVAAAAALQIAARGRSLRVD